MIQHGRKSKAAQEVTVINGGFGVERLAPPSGLTDVQARIWREIVACEPVEFFNTAASALMLKDLCVQRGESERLARLVSTFDEDFIKTPDGFSTYRGLQLALKDATHTATMLAVKLRLTNQARYTPNVASTVTTREPKGKKASSPWGA